MARKRSGQTQASEKSTSGFAAAAALIVTAINGLIAYYGWSKADDIAKVADSVKSKAAVIRKITDSSYFLYTRQMERELLELMVDLPGLELTGKRTQDIKAQIRQGVENLESLENEVPTEKRTTARFLLRGFLALDAKDCRGAIQNLQQYNSEVPIKYLLLGSAHRKCKEFDEALEMNQKVQELSLYRPTDRIVAKSLNNQGNTALMKGDMPLAIQYFEKALKRDPSLYGVHYNIAAAYARISMFKKAIKHLCKYRLSHDGDVLTEIETDPDDDFRLLMDQLGGRWEQKLMTHFQRCT